MINHLMNTRCSIEKLISAAAPYAGGLVQSPPTTKAAYLITHDTTLPYEDKWDPITNKNVPSCECLSHTCCTNRPYTLLEGEQLVGGIATWRGYTGDIWNGAPSPSSQLDLIN